MGPAAAYPWLPTAISMIGTGIDYFTRPKFPTMWDPRRFKDEITMSDAEVRGELGRFTSDIGMLGSKQIADIKQIGSAERLPEGAIASNIAGVHEGIGREAGKVYPALKREQRQSMLNYYDLLSNYDLTKFQTELGYHDRTMGGLGNMGRIALLWKAGLLQ